MVRRLIRYWILEANLSSKASWNLSRELSQLKVNCEDCVGPSTLIPLSHQERRRLTGYGLERYRRDKTISSCREEPDMTIV